MKTTMLLVLAAFAASEGAGANPIRRVVTMLQNMQKKVEEEGEKEEEMFEKFVCYCKNNTSDLEKSIDEGETAVPRLESAAEEAEATKAQIDEELANHKDDRKNANNALQTAEKNRSKENAVFEKESTESRTNINALGKAVKAISEGMGSAFLQSTNANVLKNLVLRGDLSDEDRQVVASFLSTTSQTSSSGEIVGILKQMKEDMEKDLKEMVDEENTAQTGFEEMQAAKRKEIAAATSAIEKKTQRSGELAVEIVEAKDSLDDTQKALEEDKKFIANLEQTCEQRKNDWAERQKTRAEEQQAIAETIKILNDDDALDLFKKAIPSKTSFIQIDNSSVDRARELLDGVRQSSPQLGFISLALYAKKVDFSKVLKMIDDMVVLLGQEQKDDDSHKEYCEKEFDTADDKQKEVQRHVEDAEHSIEQAETASANLAKEIQALQEGIAALDKSVAEATANRKSEHKEFVETAALNQATVDLIGFAKNRLQKFYNPKLYKAPPKRELTEEERIFVANGGTLEPTPAPGGIAGTGVAIPSFIQVREEDAPPPPPAAMGAYSKKSEESGGVMAMMDMMVNDVKKDSQKAEMEEKDAQEDYEELMADSKKKRAADSKAITTKEQAKAEADGTAQDSKDNLQEAQKELYSTKQYIQTLHNDCDFLIENFDFRKQARADESDALQKAKAVLSGADYSLLELKSVKSHSGEQHCVQQDAMRRLQMQQRLQGACEEMCKQINHYPNCMCDGFVPPQESNPLDWDNIFAKFDELAERGRQWLKDNQR